MKLSLLFIFLSGFLFSQNLDISLLRKINLQGSPSLDPSFRFVTNSVAPLTLVAPIGYITLYLVRKDEYTKKRAIFVTSTLVFSSALTTLLKYSVNRKRPFVSYPDIEKETSGGGPSFPSGHTSDAFTLATTLSILHPKWYIIIPSFAWASAVGYSRMDLGVHYPSDVLAGALLGSGSAYLTYLINKWYFANKAKLHLKKNKTGTSLRDQPL